MSAHSVTPLPSPIGNLWQYIRVVESFPVLSAEEERALAERWRRERDSAAAWQLVTSNLRHVVNIARGYSGYGLPAEDLVQEGNVGLMRAVYRFDPSRGVRLLSYATHWIRACIRDFVMRNRRLVKVATSRAKRKLFFKLRGAKRGLDRVTPGEARAIAAALEVKPQDVVEVDTRLAARDQSLDAPIGRDSGEGEPFVASLADESADPAELIVDYDFRRKAVAQLGSVLAELDERSRAIIARRWLVEESDKTTLRELAARYGISIERVRQIEAAALRRLRRNLARRLGEPELIYPARSG